MPIITILPVSVLILKARSFNVLSFLAGLSCVLISDVDISAKKFHRLPFFCHRELNVGIACINLCFADKLYVST